MSGPVTQRDEAVTSSAPALEPPQVEVSESRSAQVGVITVRRALPRRGRRTVGAWCFVDHMGPAEVGEDGGIDIGPHPHIGLQTVTWLHAGEVLHRDSLGSEKLIRPGELNLMTAGNGVVHAEERTGRYRGRLEGVQLWVAQPGETRHGTAAFEHHAALPQVELEEAVATVLVGTLAGVTSPARRDTDHVGVDLVLRPGTSTVPLEPGHEHALVCTSGAVEVQGTAVGPGRLAYLGAGRDELVLRAAADSRVLLLGGPPFPEAVLMWWNFVARTQAEVTEAQREWAAGGPRFGVVASSLPRIEVGPPPWATPGRSSG
jgi:redox-sensitive bicupin YhaK (pirin superfamily)